MTATIQSSGTYHASWIIVLPRQPTEEGRRVLAVQARDMKEKAITVMAFSESGWMRRLRVSRQAVLVLGALLVVLTLMTALLAAYAVWAAPHLGRLGAVERENRSLTVQLSEQVARLNQLQGEMSRLHELEKSLRALSGLPDRVGRDEGTGEGEMTALPTRR